MNKDKIKDLTEFEKRIEYQLNTDESWDSLSKLDKLFYIIK